MKFIIIAFRVYETNIFNWMKLQYLKASVESEVGWSFSGKIHNVSEFVSKFVVVLRSESIKDLGKLTGDDNVVEHDIIFDELHVLLWALNDINDVVEVRPVHRSLVDSFASWDGLLELLNECNN